MSNDDDDDDDDNDAYTCKTHSMSTEAESEV